MLVFENSDLAISIIRSLIGMTDDGSIPERLRFLVSTKGGTIIPWVEVSDVFEWGTADSYFPVRGDDEFLLKLHQDGVEDPDDALLALVCLRRSLFPQMPFMRKHHSLTQALNDLGEKYGLR